MPEKPKDIQKIFSEGVLIDEAMRKAARQALRIHKRAGHPLAIWHNGRVQWVSPEEFERGLANPALA